MVRQGTGNHEIECEKEDELRRRRTEFVDDEVFLKRLRTFEENLRYPGGDNTNGVK